jgi:integrase
MPIKLHNALSAIALPTAPGRYADGGGLYLRVQAGGVRSWLFRSIVGNKTRDVGLGAVDGPKAVSLADARREAKKLSGKVASGEVVEGSRTKARKAKALQEAADIVLTTFRQSADAYVESKEGGWRNEKHRQQWRNTLATYAYPVIGDMPVAMIGTDDVLKVLQPIWQAKPETASRVRGRIENVLAAAKVRGLRSGENPAQWRGHLDHLLSKPRKSEKHHPALAYAELPAFMADLRQRDAVAARALEFGILASGRTGEVIGATWAEVDMAAAVWTIPADRMKAVKEHTVPLSPRALALLKNVEPLNTTGRADAPLFPTTKGKALSNMAMDMLVRRMHQTKLAADGVGWVDRKQQNRKITVHGFRSTFRDWAGEQTAFPREVIEHAMAHQLPNKGEAAYSRATLMPKRTKLMAAWAGFADGTGSAGNVTQLRKAKVASL